MTAGATSRAFAEGQLLVLQNDLSRFELSIPYRGSVVGLTDRETGLDLADDLAYPAALFAVTAVAEDCSEELLHNLSDAAFSWTISDSDDGAGLRLEWKGLGGRALDVAATVTLQDDARRARWRISLANGGAGTTISSVAYPMLAVRARIGADASDDAVVLPMLDGVMVREPEAAFAPGQGLVDDYPGGLSLQMGAFSDPTGGLYMAALDPGGATKRIAFTRADIEGVPVLIAQMEHAVPEVAGTSFAPAYPVELGPFAGDWFDAATVYRRWAEDLPWRPAPLDQRTDVPGWWRSVTPVLSAVGYGDDGTSYVPASSMPGRAAAYAGELGVPVTLLVFGWERHGAWTSPELLPPRDGAAAMAAATDVMRADGNHAFVYVSGSVWRIDRAGLPAYDSSAAFEAVGRRWAAATCAGEVLLDPFYASIGWTSARMCPATRFWQDTVAADVAGIAALGVDVVSVDEFPIGSIYPCLATDHGHPPGSGGWQGDAWRRLLAAARSRGRLANPRLVMTSEEPSERYLDLLDGYVSRDNAPDSFVYSPFLAAWGERFEVPPIFSAVYHELVAAVAEPVQIVDDGATVLRTSRARGIASALVRGKLPAVTSVDVADADPVLLRLFSRAARAAAGPARDVVIGGRMLRPPELAVPDVAFQWASVDLASGEVDLLWQSSPAVLASAWEGDDGARVWLLANITSEQRSVELPIDAESLAVPQILSLYVDDTTTVLASGIPLPPTVTIDLPPLGLAVLRAEPRRWRRAGGAHAP